MVPFTARHRADNRFLTGWVVAVSALVVPQATLAVLIRFPEFNVVFESVDVHLVVVAAISACVFGIALAASAAARRTGQGALVMLAMGCLALGRSCSPTV